MLHSSTEDPLASLSCWVTAVSLSPDIAPFQVCVPTPVTPSVPLPQGSTPYLSLLLTHTLTLCFLPHPNISHCSPSDSHPSRCMASVISESCPHTPGLPEKPHICIAWPPDCATPGSFPVLYMTAVRLGCEILGFISYLDPVFGTFS